MPSLRMSMRRSGPSTGKPRMIAYSMQIILLIAFGQEHCKEKNILSHIIIFRKEKRYLYLINFVRKISKTYHISVNIITCRH